MISNTYKDYLLIVYQEMHAHHREQTVQNNQLIAFYIALVGFFLGFHSYLIDNFNFVLINCVFISLILIGLMINLMLIQLRVWQLRYAGAIQFLGSVFMCDKIIKDYQAFYECIKNFECRSATKHSLFAPLTCKMIWGCIIISLIPFGLYYTYLSNEILIVNSEISFIFIIVILVYLLLIYKYFRNKINDTGNKGEINWLLNYVNFLNNKKVNID